MVLIQAIVSLCEFWVYEDLPEFQQNLTTIYQNMNRFNYSILLDTAVGYYDELKELVSAVDYGEYEADVMLRNIYDAGGPLHAYNPPYEKLSKGYMWTKQERDGYEDLMNKTCKVWNALKIKVKSPEELEPESSGNF
ncbi:hypothetical protein J6590_058643 [Homalodisca vitripennis]|nr:hypothetical protein J6590_058643 [Homalodisca vitripennis]